MTRYRIEILLKALDKDGTNISLCFRWARNFMMDDKFIQFTTNNEVNILIRTEEIIYMRTKEEPHVQTY